MVPSVAQQSGVILKSTREIELMRNAGRIVFQVLQAVRKLVKPGVTTAQLNEAAEALIEEASGIALFKGVTNPQAKFPFPAALCTSVNEELVHGIPNDRELKEGDIVGVDCGVRLAGYCGDSATTIPVGKVAPDVAHLLEVTKRALGVAVEEIRPGIMWSEVAKKIQAYVESEKLSVVRDFVGHGIGKDMHEDPKVPNYWDASQRRSDFELLPSMVIAVEPMVNIGSHQVDYGDGSKWVVVTRDRKFSAHFEHTIAVSQTGADVLTDGR